MLKKWIGSWLDDAPQQINQQKALTLNLKKTLVAHDDLQKQLELEIANQCEMPLNSFEIAKVDADNYGKWLTSVGNKTYSKTKEYKNALEAHTFFRQIAGDVIYMHQTGNSKKARKILKTGFKEASNLNQIELVRLYNLTIN